MTENETSTCQLVMPAGIVFPMMKVATMLELPLQKITEDFAIDLEAILQSDIISIQQFEILIEGLIALSPNKDFHIHFAQVFTFSHIEGMEALIINNTTGFQALREVFSYKELFLPLFDVVVEPVQHHDLLIYASNDQLPVSNKYYYAEMLFVLIQVFGYRLLDFEHMAEKIAFRHQRPDYHDSLESLFKCSISYGNDVDVAWVKKDVLDSAFKTKQNILHNSAQELLEKKLEKVHKTRGIISQVESIIYSNLGDLNLSVDTVSKQLSISSRKLQRLLQQQEVSFSMLKKRVRIVTARALLLRTRRSLSEISETLGFADVSSFSRFFSNIEQCSPSQYRKQGMH